MKDSKKILIVTPFFYPAWHYGGPPRVMFDLCNAFAKEGYDVTCATTDVLDSGRYEKSEDNINGIRVLYFKNISNKLAYYLKVFTPKGLGEYLSENVSSFDIVHIVDFRNTCTYLAYKACKKNNVPYVITPYGSLPYEKGLRGFVKSIIDRRWGFKCLREAKSVIVQTENEYNEAIKLGVSKENISLIPLMIDSQKFRTENIQDDNIRRKYNIPSSAKIILFVGRINKYKATSNMLRSVANLIGENSNEEIYLLIVGRDDGYENRLKEIARELKIGDKVIFARPVFFPDITAIYKSANVFFMAPTHFEETSTASLEALACGTPVVLTEQADVPYFNKYEVGFIVKNEIPEMVKALKMVLIEKRFKIQDCTQIIEENFSVEKIKERYIENYFKN